MRRAETAACANCDGTGACPECGGEGRFEDGEECDVCGTSTDCPECNGMGRGRGAALAGRGEGAT
jgi:hypothetical protein